MTRARARLASFVALALAPACATVPNRSAVVSLASRILSCSPDAIHVRVAPLDEVCAERVQDTAEDGRPRLGPCVAWTPLDWPAEQRPSGWLVEGCGHVDRFAPHSCDARGLEGQPIPAEHALDAMIECWTF